jgi:hypothetical protein
MHRDVMLQHVEAEEWSISTQACDDLVMSLRGIKRPVQSCLHNPNLLEPSSELCTVGTL